MERKALAKEIEKRLDIPLKIYPLEFPDSVDDCGIIVINDSIPTAGNITETYIDVYVRSRSIDDAESYSLATLNALDNCTDMFVKDMQVINIKAQGKYPIYEGKDDNNRFYFRQSFRFLED